MSARKVELSNKLLLKDDTENVLGCALIALLRKWDEMESFDDLEVVLNIAEDIELTEIVDVKLSGLLWRLKLEDNFAEEELLNELVDDGRMTYEDTIDEKGVRVVYASLPFVDII